MAVNKMNMKCTEVVLKLIVQAAGKTISFITASNSHIIV